MCAGQLLPGLALLAGYICWASAQQDGVPAPGAKREVLVKEVVIDSALDDIVYAGKRHEFLLVTTTSKRLYFSKDSGQNWQEITNSVDPAQDTELQVERVLVSPADPTVVVLQTKRRDRTALGGRSADGKWWPYIYVSEDSGTTWRKAWGKHHGLHSWIPHPKNRAWALVSWWSGACESSVARPKSAEDSGPCVHRLMITRDLGKTLTQIATYVVQFSWGSETVDQANTVYYTAYRSKNGDQSTLSSWTSEVDLHSVRLSSKGRPMGGTEVLRHGNKFLVSREFILVAKVKNEALQTVSLLTSTDGAKTFKVALLPSGMGELEEKWYTVLDTSEGAVVLHVSAAEGAAKETGRIFVSDAEGRRFTQALVDNVRSASGDCEFDKILGLHGAYMANIVVPPGDGGAGAETFRAQRNSAEEEAESEASGETAVDRRHSAGKKKQANKEERIVRTVISFDKGGAWRYLKPPRVDSLGKAYDCANRPAEECSLHLHGTTSSRELYAPYYSQENAVGIIMGTGNVGSSLRFEPGETNTYLSRDGGLTWVEAHKGAFIYEFGDHGGLIVMADVVKKTREVVFSWNEGQSWFDFKVSEVNFEVDNVLIEPNTTATTFLMYGTREEGVGVLYYMQFDTLKFPPCQGQWAADSVSSDYETWSPSDGVNEEKCLLGQKVTYTRRKRTSQCWNGEEFERPVVKSQCECTQEDYACDLGFVRAVGSVDCKYGGPEMMPQLFVPRMCTGYWMADAYMKVPGDRCEGGWQPSRAAVPCPWTQTATSSVWALVATLVIVFGFVAYTRNGGGKAKGDMTFEVHAAVSRFTQLFDAAKDSGSWMRSLVSRDNGYARVGNNEFEFSTMNEEASLTSFIDEAEREEPPPQAIGAAASRAPHYDIHSDDEGTRPSVVAGGANKATEAVPRLQAPPGASMPAASGAPAVGDSDDGLL